MGGDVREQPAAGDPTVLATALEVLERSSVAVFVVTYNAEKYVRSVLDRIPAAVRERLAEIVVIDDSSTDETYKLVESIAAEYDGPLSAYRTPYNRGYGGNQKLGYLYAQQRGYDIVVLLHGDGQYAPECLPELLAPFAAGADVVLGSRMLTKRAALAGGMPAYKWLGNQALTGILNRILRMDLAEFHTGYRAYRVAALGRLPFAFNSDDFHFDVEILIQANACGLRIVEVPIPTHYGDEVCHVSGPRYAVASVRAALRYRLVRLGVRYTRNFDLGLFNEPTYFFKRSPRSLHQFVLRHPAFRAEAESLELGANRGYVSRGIAERVKRHLAVDLDAPAEAGRAETAAMDLNEPFAAALGASRFDVCVALDVIEHLQSPERFLEEVATVLRPGGTLLISTANVAYLPMRASLLLGSFRYGKRGILDLTHTRLFTVASFCTMLEEYGFRLHRVRGFAPPVVDLIGRGWFWRATEAVHAWLSRRLPRLFGYNFLVEAERMDSVGEIFAKTTGIAAETGPPPARPPGERGARWVRRSRQGQGRRR